MEKWIFKIIKYPKLVLFLVLIITMMFFKVMKDKLEAMACWAKYKTYTSSSSMPVITRELLITE